jgi:hypothetical protein
MLEDMGDEIKSYLRSFCMAVKFVPRAAGLDGMDSAAAVESADLGEVAKAEPEADTEPAKGVSSKIETKQGATMSASRYATMARKHWTTWLPKKVAALKAEDQLEPTLQTVGKLAQERVLELMQQGFQQHEAEEVALSELILLTPERRANVKPWERKEEAALEAMFRKQTDSKT